MHGAVDPWQEFPEEYRGSERRKTLRRRPAVLARSLLLSFFFFFLSLNSRDKAEARAPRLGEHTPVCPSLVLEFLRLCQVSVCRLSMASSSDNY